MDTIYNLKNSKGQSNISMDATSNLQSIQEEGDATEYAEQTEEFNDKMTPVDGGWDWLVCLASFWTNGAVMGTINCFGIIYVELVQEFKTEDDIVHFKLSWMGTLQVVLMYFLSICTGLMMDTIGLQLVAGIGAILAAAGMLISSFFSQLEVLYLTYGIMVGVGSSFVYLPSLTILGHYFKKRLGLVSGLVTLGSAAFTIVLSLLLPVILSSIGLRNTMRIFSACLALIGFFPFIWKPVRNNGKNKKTLPLKCTGIKIECKEYTKLKDVFKMKGYIVWVAGYAFTFLGYVVPFFYLVEHSKTKFPDANAEVFPLCLGGISGVSRLAIGKLADVPHINRVWIQQFSILVFGGFCLVIPFISEYPVLVFLACVMGVADGGMFCMDVPIGLDMLGKEKMAQGLGLLLTVRSLPLILGLPLGGYLRDVTGDYQVTFIAAGLAVVAGACMFTGMPQARRRCGKNCRTTTSTTDYAVVEETEIAQC